MTQQPTLKQANSTKLQDVDDPFEIAPKVQKKQQQQPVITSFNTSNDNADLEYEA